MTKLDDARLREIYFECGTPVEFGRAVRDEALREAAEVCDAINRKGFLSRYDLEDCACAILSLIPQPKEEGK